MLLHNRIGHRQAESGPLAHFLGGEERVEDLRLQVVGNAGAIVVDFEHDRFLPRVVPRPHHERAASVRGKHRLFGIHDQIQQHLLDLMAIGEDLRQPGGERLDDGHVVDALLIGAEGERFAGDLIHVHHRPRRLPLPRERQQVPNDARGALGFGKDRFETAPDRLVQRRLLREPLRPVQDRGERIVQLVRHS